MPNWGSARPEGDSTAHRDGLRLFLHEFPRGFGDLAVLVTDKEAGPEFGIDPDGGNGRFRNAQTVTATQFAIAHQIAVAYRSAPECNVPAFLRARSFQ